MEIFHRFSIVPTKKTITEYKAVGIDLHEGFCSFTVSESDKNWSAIKRLNAKHELLSMIDTKFTAKEKSEALFLEMVSNWHCGYPEPSDDAGYLSKTYDNTGCETCGTGAKQRNAFFFKKVPRFSPQKILQLNWVFDEFFVQEDLWEALFSPLGITKKPIKLLKSEAELPGIVQLEIPETLHHLNLDGYPYEECQTCHEKKYLPVSRGFFPSLKETTNLDLFKAADFFGSGHSASKAVIVSAKLYRLICEAKIKGVSFAPLASM